ncbi:hypothetical protein GQ607_003211 [Colletotrichum asianum]|uniref:Uncharacterized protein n=1 Tax=Colletotrichum asianum TaxID=702518 RepID=A0A8H3WS66_9PEZI|nr:hypothetical protein GQ607_003211 [Colletotrichum asianum]
MSDFRYLPFPLPADATLTLTTTITRDLSTPIPTTTAPPSITTNSLQDPSQTLSITTITLRVTDAPSNSSSILSTAISSSPTPTPTPTPSGPAHKPTVRGDITPTFYILALVPILVMILCAYESYTHRKIDAKQKHITTTRAAAPRNHPNGDIELQDLSTAPAAPLRQYWWFEDDTVTDQVSTDTDDRGVPYNSLCHPRPPLPLPSLWTASWWPYSRGSGQGRPHGTLPGWGRRHTFSECGSYPSTFDPSRPRLGLKFEPLDQEVRRRGRDGRGGGEVYSRRLIVGRDADGVIQIATDTAPAAAETDLVPSRPSTPDWAAGIPSYYNNGRSPTLNNSSSVSSCSSTSVADKGKAKASSSSGNRNEATTAAAATGTDQPTTTAATSRRPRNVAAGEGSSSSTDASQSADEPKNLPPRCDTCKAWPLIEWPRLCTSCGRVV